MSDLSELEPRAVWRVFDGICKIPHPSGKEEKLVAALCAEAERSGLLCRRDACGNLRIDRKGGDFDRAVLLQAHLDMVPSCVEGKNFDFETQSISPVVENGIVRADGTTLGGDDGMGVALALAALEAPELSDLPLAALFTREEETGMIGAQALDDEFLRGAAMVNLDSGCDEVFQTGCAGGVRSRIFFEPESVPAPEGEGVSIRIDGLAGGHSGIDIGKGRANAFVLLAKIVKNTAFYPAEFFGGKADNVIPSSAGCRGVAVVPVDALRSVIAARADRLRKTMTVDRDFRVEVEPAAVSAVWESAFAGKFTALLASVPDGAVAFSRKYGTVRTSTNVAAVETMPRGFALTTSQRSFDDGERTRIAAKVCRHFRSIASGWDFSKGYPGWKPENSPWLRRAAEHWRRVNGTEAVFEAVHAGVECGIFRGRRENLPIFACFPRHGGLHTPAEFLDIASVGRVWKFLISFLREAAHAGNERN